jgi:hypothetical protein
LGLIVEKTSLDDEMLKLLDGLTYVMEQSKRIKRENIPSRLLFEVYCMTDNRKSMKFAESASWINPKAAEVLLQQGLVQRIASDEDERYALTFKGIARCVKKKYGKDLEDQFEGFLELSDQKFNTVDQTTLQWNEKLASISLVLLASTSPSSAIRLNDEANKKVLAEVFQKTLACLKKFYMIRKEEELKTISRGESLASALMSRLLTLSRKTNHYYKYIGKGSEYFFDIEKNGDVDEKRLFFLLKRIFEQYDPDCDYGQMYRELAEISQFYYPRFRARSTSSTVVLSMLRKLKDFMDKEILHLPLKMANKHVDSSIAPFSRSTIEVSHKSDLKLT